MVTEATKKFRDIFSYGLLVVAALYLLSGLSLLFKSEDEVGPFTERAALFGHVFASPVLVLSLLGAVALAVGFGSQSLNAKLIVTAALAIAAAALLFALISWFSGFGVDSGGFGLEAFGGVLGAGKIVSILLGLAQLLALGLTEFSLHPSRLLEVRRAIAQCDMAALRAAAPALRRARERAAIVHWLAAQAGQAKV